MGTPQIILLVLLGADIGMAMARHGKPKEGHHSFGITVVAAALHAGLLVWGGFFNG